MLTDKIQCHVLGVPKPKPRTANPIPSKLNPNQTDPSTGGRNSKFHQPIQPKASNNEIQTVRIKNYIETRQI